MKIVIAGGTGLVGKALVSFFKKKKYDIYILTRKKPTSNNEDNVTYVRWLNDGDCPEKYLQDIEVFINLAGESINSGRWSEERKNRILTSRLTATKEITRIITELQHKPKLLINASAIGFYGTSTNETFTENSITQGKDFLSTTVSAWEKEAKKVESADVRLIYARFGIILDKKGGALPKLLLPYKLFAGGNLGTGNQWMSWIHIDDVVHAILTLYLYRGTKRPC